MQNKITMGAVGVILAAFLAGCAPSTNPQAQSGSTTGAYGTTAGYGGGSANYGSTGGTTPVNNGGGYDYSGASGSGAYGYGSGAGTSTGGGSGSYYDYSAPGSSGSSYGGGSSYGSGGYSSGGGYSGGGSYSGGSAGGSYAVQVVATQNRSTADTMRGQMQSMGFNAVVDNVGGMYKVRIPFSSENEAKASLSRIRSSVPDAFYTVR